MGILRNAFAKPNRIDMPLTLKTAMVCIDCEHVFSSSDGSCCPKCTSGQTVALSKWIPTPAARPMAAYCV